MSSSDIVVQVEKLGKCFNIYERPGDRLKQMILPRLNALTGRSAPQNYHQEFWALKDITFEVQRGQTVGIIGQNGSGKSTLLQIITGTMAPTCGTVSTQGQVAALLELGSGFNPEFTGRENIFMNGTVLGLTHQEIEEKFDYIAAFADIGEHLEHPVKTYSSGMMLRLAFAVQVAVETEILIIDEALAVGDARFQMKCFKRLEELKAQGTTILFVSHDTTSVRSFCDVGLVLDKGRAIYLGDAKAATVEYFRLVFPDQYQRPVEADKIEGDSHRLGKSVLSEDCLAVFPDNKDVLVFGVGGAVLDWLKIYGLEKPNIIIGGRETKIVCRFNWDVDIVKHLVKEDGYKNNVTIGVAVADKKGVYLFGCNGFDCGLSINPIEHSEYTVEFTIAMPHLVSGDYFLSTAIALGDLQYHVQLRWYESMLNLKYIDGPKKIFGILGVEYRMKEICLVEE